MQMQSASAGSGPGDARLVGITRQTTQNPPFVLVAGVDCFKTKPIRMRQNWQILRHKRGSYSLEVRSLTFIDQKPLLKRHLV
jgi:hypothetical protein